jgi:Xaa-Pro aminopeptidase
LFDYVERRRRAAEILEREGIDAMFIGLSSDLEYLTGIERNIPTFGNVSYAHGWVGGAFFKSGSEPLFILPRMFAEFDLPHGRPDNLVVVNETDDGRVLFDKAAHSLGGVKRLAISSRLWGETVMNLVRVFDGAELVNAEPIVNRLRRVKSKEELEVMTRACRVADETMGAVTDLVKPGVTMHQLVEAVEHEMRTRGSRTASFTTHIFSMGMSDERESIDARGQEPLREGESVLFDFGAVVDGYCSDFGRTIFCGEPTAEYRRAYQAMIDGQAAGQAAARPGVTCAEVNRACRAPIEEAGFGDYFRPLHRHGRARATVHQRRGSDAARGGHDLHRRALDHVARHGRRADREHRRVRGKRGPEAQLISHRPGRQRLTAARRRRERAPRLRLSAASTTPDAHPACL